MISAKYLGLEIVELPWLNYFRKMGFEEIRTKNPIHATDFSLVEVLIIMSVSCSNDYFCDSNLCCDNTSEFGILSGDLLECSFDLDSSLLPILLEESIIGFIEEVQLKNLSRF